jgi:hypothetical protein
VILTTLYLAGAKNTYSWHARKGDLQHAFSLNVLMVPSSVIAIVADGERLMCGGFSLGETICLRKFEFIVDYFGCLSLSPRRGDEGAALMGSTRSRASTPWRAMIEDSSEEFLATSSGEGSFGLPSPRRCNTGAPFAPTTTTPWMVDAPATMMFPRIWCHHGRKPTSPLSDATLVKNGSRHKPMLIVPPPSRGQLHDEASSPASRPLPWFNHMCHLGTSISLRWRGS